MTAMGFITLPTPSEHSAPMEELRKMVLRWYPELKEKVGSAKLASTTLSP